MGAALLVAAGIGGYYWLDPHVEPYRVYIEGNSERSASGWEILRPWAAWPVLAAYGAPLFVLLLVLAVLAGGSIGMAEERRALSRREQTATGRMREANNLMQEARRARRLDQDITANAKREGVALSRQAARDRGKRIRAVGQLRRRREQLMAAQREIERLRAAAEKTR